MISYQNVEATVLESRVDWITCTARKGEGALKLLQFAQDRQREEGSHGERQETWKMQTYIGFQCGEWRWGWNRDGCIVVVSREEAHQYADQLALLANHWSRLDYCVTVQEDAATMRPDEDYWEQYRKPTNWRGQIADLGRRQSKAGAPTVELGSRSSPRYVRVYNKTAESKGEYPPNCWRWEIELKQGESEHEQALWQSGMVNGERILNMLSSHLAPYSLQVPWPEGAVIKRMPAIRHAREADRLLAWFERQVAPSVRYVAEARGRDAVLRALNL